jgi:hypothetical protein
VGRVLSTREGRFLVDAGAGEYAATKALACLVEPMVGDRVLVALAGDGSAYVLSVLEREGTRTELVVPGDLEIRVPAGRCVVGAKGGVDLVSSAHVGVTGEEVRVHARAGTFFVEQLAHVGSVVATKVDELKIHAAALDATVERVTERLKRVYRFVSEFDHLRAERVDWAAKKNMSLRAENAVVIAEELVKIDGSQIHLG